MMDDLHGMKMRVTCKKDEILERLRINRAKHSKIVKEAREGYVKKAKAELGKKLLKLEQGKLVRLHFTLAVPSNHTKEYDTAIHMLEMHIGETIELGASEVRQFIEDKWDWQQQFIYGNAAYSGTAAAMVDDLEED
jgi:hypothetical protein